MGKLWGKKGEDIRLNVRIINNSFLKQKNIFHCYSCCLTKKQQDMDYVEYMAKEHGEEVNEYIDELLSSEEFTVNQKERVKDLLQKVYKLGRFHIESEEFMKRIQKGNAEFPDKFGIMGICIDKCLNNNNSGRDFFLRSLRFGL